MGNRRPPDRDVAPVVQRVRIRYARRGRLRFSSHRDFQRALERAIRRAGLPIAFTLADRLEARVETGEGELLFGPLGGVVDLVHVTPSARNRRT